MNTIFLFSKKKLFYCVFLLVFSGFSWIAFSDFHLANIANGYDSYRFMYFAVNGCPPADSEACSQLIVRYLSALGSSSVPIYFSFTLVNLFLLSASSTSFLLPCIIKASPVIVYFLAQPGKDSFTALASIGFATLLFSFQQLPKLSFSRPASLSLKQSFLFIRLLLPVCIGVLFRPSLAPIFLSYAIFFRVSLLGVSSSLKLFYSVVLFSLFCLLAIFWSLNVLQLDPNFAASDFFGTSFLDSGSIFSGLVGFSVNQYFQRLLFNIAYIFLYPLRLLALPLWPGYQYLFGLCLAMQVFILYRGRLLVPFFRAVLPLSIFISSYPFPNLRYMAGVLPLAIIYAAYRHRRGSI